MKKIEKTELLIADSDKPLAFLELSDEALGRFCRSYLIMMEQKVHQSAGDRQMPISLTMSMHGSIALYRMAFQANVGEMTLEHYDVEWRGKNRGDWQMTLKQTRQPAGLNNGD